MANWLERVRRGGGADGIRFRRGGRGGMGPGPGGGRGGGFWTTWEVRLALVVLPAAVLVGAAWFFPLTKPVEPVVVPSVALGDFLVAGQGFPLRDFLLIDHHGGPFGPERFQGAWSLVLFGYSRSPLGSSMAMGVMAEVFRLLDANPSEVRDEQGILVTVDPGRDLPVPLGRYVTHFSPDFIGVTGDDHAVRALAGQMGADYSVGGDPISHPNAFYLVDPAGRLTAVFPSTLEAPRIIQLMQQIRER